MQMIEGEKGKNIRELWTNFREGLSIFDTHGFSKRVEDLILPYLQYRYDESNEFCGPFFRNFKRLLDMYKVKDMATTETQGNSILTVPIVHWTMNSISAKVASALTAASPYNQFIPQNTVSDDLAKAAEIATQYMFIKSDYELVSDKFGFNVALFGKGYLAGTVDARTKIPYIYSPHPSTVRIDPYYPSIRDGQRFVFEERRVTFDRFLENQENKTFYDFEIPGVRGSASEIAIKEETAKGSETIKQDTTGNEILILDRFLCKTHTIILCNQSKIAQIRRNPLGEIPMRDTNWNELDGEVFSLGAIEACRNLITEFSITRNQSIKFKNMIMAGMWKTTRGNCDEDKILIEAGKIIECDNPSALMPLHERLINILQYAAETENTIMNNIQSTTSVHDLMLGQGTDRRETATTTTAMSKGMNSVFDRRIKRYETTSIADVARMMWKMFYYVTPMSKKIKISESMVELSVTPQDIGLDCDIYPLGSSVYDETNKELQRNQVIQAMNVALARPETLSYLLFGELLQQFFDTFNWKSKRRFVRSEEEQKKYLAEIQVAEAMKARIAKGEDVNGNNTGANNRMMGGGQGNMGDMQKVAKG